MESYYSLWTQVGVSEPLGCTLSLMEVGYTADLASSSQEPDQGGMLTLLPSHLPGRDTEAQEKQACLGSPSQSLG